MKGVPLQKVAEVSPVNWGSIVSLSVQTESQPTALSMVSVTVVLVVYMCPCQV